MPTSPSLMMPALAGGVAALVAWAAMPVICRWAVSRGALTQAREDRWHTGATPAFGGVGIFLAMTAALGAGSLVGTAGGGPSWLLAMADPRAAGLLGAAALMFLLGLVDDLRDLNPATKLVVQLLAASILVSSGYLVDVTGITVIDVVVSLGWFVGITNAVNLLDNMNGLAGGVAAIAAVYLGLMVVGDGPWLLAVVAFALAGACLGFLAHNYPRAGIFMGDSGSLLIGVSLAALALAPAPSPTRGRLAAMAVPLLVLAVPILDTVLVTVSRLAEGRPVSQGGRDHASHRLVAAGMIERRAVRLLWLFGGLSGAVALALRSSQRSFAVLLGGVVLLGLATVGAHLLGIQVRERVGGRTLLARVLASNRHWPALSMGLDVIALALAYYGAYLLRWDGAELTRELAYFRETLALVITAKVLAFAAFKVYGSPLRHLSVEEAERIAVANLTGSGAAFLGAVMVFDYGFSRGILVMDFVLGLLLTLGYRFPSGFWTARGARGRTMRCGWPSSDRNRTPSWCSGSFVPGASAP